MSTSTPILAYLPYAELARIQSQIDDNHVRLLDLLEHIQVLEELYRLAMDKQAHHGRPDLTGAFADVSRKVRRITKSMGKVNQQLMTQHNAAQPSV